MLRYLKLSGILYAFAPNRTLVVRLQILLVNHKPLKKQIRKWKLIKVVEQTIENYSKYLKSNYVIWRLHQASLNELATILPHNEEGESSWLLVGSLMVILYGK